KLRGREVAPPSDYMEKLRSRKAEVEEQLDRSRAATRFEPPPLPTPSAPLNEPLLEGGESPAGRRAAPKPAAQPGLAPAPQSEPESYTSRLMRAKQKVWEEREKEQGS